MKKIFFLVPYPTGAAPSQRFRFEQYYDLLLKNNCQVRISPFLDQTAWKILYHKGQHFLKAFKILAGFKRRINDIFAMRDYDFVFIHREAAPIGPPVIEWVIAKILKKRIIYDFDDAIWLSNTSEHNQIIARFKWHDKVKHICQWSYKVSCGNEYLADFARLYNQNVIINPTTIDTVNLHNRVKDQNTARVVIGWTGTHSTSQYLQNIIPVIEKLEKTHDFTFAVISNGPLNINLKSLRYIRWNKDTEMDDLIQFNIGLMPLIDDKWAKGKCGFKALQYMSLGIPAIVSPVGVNTKIVDHGINGSVCTTPQEWEAAIAKYLTQPALRTKIGEAARKKIEQSYSVKSNASNFLSLFD